MCQVAHRGLGCAAAAQAVEEVRRELLRFFNADPKEYEVHAVLCCAVLRWAELCPPKGAGAERRYLIQPPASPFSLL